MPEPLSEMAARISRRKGGRVELLKQKRYGDGGQKSKAAEPARRAVADALMLMHAAEPEGEAAPRACKALDATCSDVEFASESRQKRTPYFPLLELPEELQLLVAAHVVSSPCDRAALCLAIPPLALKEYAQLNAMAAPSARVRCVT